MTINEQLKSLLATGESMRIAQKNYFKTTDKETKRGWLIESKNLERQFDNLIHNLKQLNNLP